MAAVAARAGLNLEVVSSSAAATGFFPDFTLSPGDDGRSVIRQLLSLVPDVVFIEGNQVCLVNPQASDASVYGYGAGHAVGEGRYRRGAWEASRVQVEGYNATGGNIILVESFVWAEIDRVCDRFRHVGDRNIGTVDEAGQRGQAVLREAEIQAAAAAIFVPVNCGQQLYDVIDVTDARAGLAAAKMRVLGFLLVYDSRRGEYRQQLRLGAV